MMDFILLDRRVISSCIFLIVVLLSTSTSSAVEDTIYEEYCFSGLMQLMDERNERLEINSFEEFLDNSEVIQLPETPIRTLGLSNEFGKKDVRVYVYRDVMESQENEDMLFYYTDVYGDDYEFFGCAITSNNLSMEGLVYDTLSARIEDSGNVSVQWNTSFLRNYTSSASKINLFSNSITDELDIGIERLILNDVVFNLYSVYFIKSSIDGSIKWRANLTLLIPYVEELPGKRSWDEFIEFRNTDLVLSIDRGMVKDIKQNKTTSVLVPDLDPVKPPGRGGIDYFFISQIIVAVLVTILVFYFIRNRRRELEEWGSEDE